MFCTIHCNPGYVVAITRVTFYQCDPNGNWNGKDTLVFPDCSGLICSVARSNQNINLSLFSTKLCSTYSAFLQTINFFFSFSKKSTTHHHYPCKTTLPCPKL